MVLHMFVFVFLLVVCLFLSLALLWRLDWFHRRPSHAQGGTKRPTVQRLLKPRCPDDCPGCRLASTASSGGEPALEPVRPWREVKSRRGAPKQIHTEGYASNPAKTLVTPVCSILCKTLSEQEKLRKIEGKNCSSIVQADHCNVGQREGDSCLSNDLNVMSQPMTGTSCVPCSKIPLN